jgi:hypothetical protein
MRAKSPEVSLGAVTGFFRQQIVAVCYARGISKKLHEITWPSGKAQSLEAIAANQILTVHEPAR